MGELFSEKPAVAYRRGRNIGDNLVRSRLRNDTNVSHMPGTHACGSVGCHSCPFLDNVTCISGPRRSFTIKRSFTCQHSNLVYILRCNKCGILYVGETGRTLDTRCSEHISDIKHNRGTTVADHFNLSGHSEYDVRIQVLWQMANGDIVDRKSMESHFMDLLGTLLPSGLNLKA